MLNEVPKPFPTGKVAGFANFVPKPEPDHGYADTKGVVTWATAISLSLVEKSTPKPLPVGKVAGFANLVPKPEPDHGYADTKGVVKWAIAT